METKKPLAIIKQFFFDGKAGVHELQAAIAGFTRPLANDADFRWLVEEAAKVLGVEVNWATA